MIQIRATRSWNQHGSGIPPTPLPHTPFFRSPTEKDGHSCARYNKQHHQAHANQRWHLPFRLLPDEAPGLEASRTGKNNITVAYPN